jgi:ribosome-binding factor A
VTRRAEQMASTLRDAIQQVIDRGLSDPRISGLITITSLRVTDDLKNAIITVSVLPEPKQELTLHGLKAAARHIRHQAGELIEIKQMPELIFKLDQSLKKQAQVFEAIHRASEQPERKPWGASHEHPPPESGPAPGSEPDRTPT